MTDIYDQHNAASSRECQTSQREGEVTMKVKATYSPEDNKIRLYPSERLDAKTYEKVKAHGLFGADYVQFVPFTHDPSTQEILP